MFFDIQENEIDPKDYIPILNKSSQQPIQTSPTPSTSETTQNEENNDINNNNTSKQHKNNKINLPKEYSDYYYFMAYEHFALSRATIKEMCLPGTACDEKFTQLPQIGVSCLSLNDLWSEQAEMQGEETRPENLSFIKLINYKENTRHWVDIEPLPSQILTISLDCADKKGLKIRFSIMQEPPSSWFWIKYPVLVNDFSLVIGIEKKELLRRCIFKGEIVFEGSLQILTTFGLLNALYDQEKKKREENNDENEENIIKFNLDEEEEEGKQKEECIFCFRKGSNILFYPCNHCKVHEKCLVGKKVDKCYFCDTKCKKLIKLKFPQQINNKNSMECLFCEYGKCQKFDCYYYPCGCALGCFDGFKKALEKQESKMSLRCVNCGNMIENVMQFYRG
uniref:Uncharacterized protein n=1 Tax=Meloidogyne enterolobii TaxID=390850 RepID=A0A6V7V5X6_MELEN|nr:unnamed protein product [Meloidogyne enterolobii]